MMRVLYIPQMNEIFLYEITICSGAILYDSEYEHHFHNWELDFLEECIDLGEL